MIAALMGYSLSIALLMSLAAWTIERALAARCWPRRGAWAAAILASFAVPAGMMWIAQQRQPLSIAGPTTSVPVIAESVPPVRDIERVTVPQPRWVLPSLPELDAALRSLWMAGSLGLLGFFGVSWMRLRRMLESLQRQDMDGVSVRVSDQLGPAVFGLVNPQIIIPRWLVDAPQATRAMVLAHERSHIGASDPMLFIAALLFIALAPWNVPLWWQLRRLRFAIEVDCDQRVLRGGVDVSTYGEMLLTVWQRNSRSPVGTMALTEPVSELERRIRIMTLTRSRSARLLLVACGMFSISLVLAAGQLEPPNSVLMHMATSSSDDNQAAVPAADGDTVQNRVMFMSGTDFAQSPQTIAMRQRLKDPEQRKAVRREQRAMIQQQHPELAQVLLIDSSLEAELIELFTDRQMMHLERLYAEPSGTEKQSGPLSQQERADEETRELAKMRALLGADRLEQYQEYERTVGVRRQAAIFDARLDRYGKLTPDQKERLIGLLWDEQDKERRSWNRVSRDAFLAGPPTDFFSENRAQVMLIRNVEVNEDSFRHGQEASRVLLERLPEVLTPPQLDVFAQMEAEKISAQRKYVEQMRVEAGMTPEIPEKQPAARGVTRKPITGQWRLEVRLKVNRSEPENVVLVTENGKAAAFEAPEGLMVEAIPVLFEDGWLDVDLKFYEQGREGRRAIGEMVGMGMLITPSDGSTRLSRTGTSAVVTGSKAYAIEAGFNASPVL